MAGNSLDRERIAAFVARWQGVAGGAERANYQIFVGELCEALDLPRPGIAAGGELSAYQYEGPVTGGSLAGGTGFIDVYRRGHFILEAKQSRLTKPQQATPELFDPAPAAPAAPSGARYDQLMRDARRQAEQYARSLPGSHPPVPFLIVADIGRAFELYFDYAGNGRGYAFFPDKQRYRIALADLMSEAPLADLKKTPAEVLRAIWTDPASIDPRIRAADVTRDVARKLALVSQNLEGEGKADLKRRHLADAAHQAELIENTALFLMRVLFCMFAEDVGLLPRDRFTEFLQGCVKPDDPDRPGDLVDHATLRAGLTSLWKAMDTAGPEEARYAFAMRENVRWFNGGLFASQAVYPLGIGDLTSLINAAKHSWTNVEPAIFGTLLEQALSPADRAKLGAHYTPRPYVERLVQATITDVLQPEWAAAEDAIKTAQAAGDTEGALARATGFLAYLQAQRVLDPACGTGNFLYVAMETLLRLESDVIETIAALGGAAAPTIGPKNFLGLELNPRAAVIAELVLWIGWLRWRTANDPAAVPDPVLERTGSINFGSVHGYDAVLARDEAGEVIQPPLLARWPEADFIVGNPPFIAGQDMRREFGKDAEAIWTANERVGGGADFVMQWWDHAAVLLTRPGTPLRRFGFVTTNSITQDFSHRVIARHLASPTDDADGGLSLVFAIPDHPWLKQAPSTERVRRKKGEEKKGGPAAVRIAMTVAEAGLHHGNHASVVAEHDLATDNPRVNLERAHGRIHADLSIGTNVVAVTVLRSNTGICHDGVKLHGKGFAIDRALATELGRGRRQGLDRYIRPYRNGMDLSQRNPVAVANKYVIDFHGLSERVVRQSYPEAYQHLDVTVRAARQAQYEKSPTKDAETYLANWWLFGKSRPEMQPALAGLFCYIVTVDTAKHRVFQFVDSATVCDDGCVIVCSADAYRLGVLQSKAHVVWARRVGGTLEDRPRYFKSKTFDPFPFPDPTPEQRAAIGELGEDLDATRKAALAEHPRLTMTGLYNLVEKLRAGAALTAAEEADARDGRARIVRHLHDRIDAAVAAAYGWPADLAPAEIVARLVALNAERAAEEAAGHVRWLRPDYQIPRFGRDGDR